MANQFGEDPAFYIFPTDHVDGEPFPENFYSDLYMVLRANGFDCEPV